jgi:L-serine dehydratase
MAAAVVAYLPGGSLEETANASAISLKSLMGLLCDPVVGLSRPVHQEKWDRAVLSTAAADMALAGVVSGAPLDGVILAMKNVEGLMHEDLGR